MDVTAMDVTHSGYPRHRHDFYIEDEWCFDALPVVLGPAEFAKGIYDPCCGIGTIPQAAQRFQLQALGSDIIDRQRQVGLFNFAGLRDFLDKRTQAGCWPSMVFNPPYGETQKFIEKALTETQPGGVVAVLTRMSFLSAQARYNFFRQPEMERAIILSKRPSMPDGDVLLAGKVKRGNGKTNYLWLVFRSGGRHGAAPLLDWWMPPLVKLPPKARRRSSRETSRNAQPLPGQLDMFDGDAGGEPGAVDADQGASS